MILWLFVDIDVYDGRSEYKNWELIYYVIVCDE